MRLKKSDVFVQSVLKKNVCTAYFFFVTSSFTFSFTFICQERASNDHNVSLDEHRGGVRVYKIGPPRNVYKNLWIGTNSMKYKKLYPHELFCYIMDTPPPYFLDFLWKNISYPPPALLTRVPHWMYQTKKEKRKIISDRCFPRKDPFKWSF